MKRVLAVMLCLVLVVAGVALATGGPCSPSPGHHNCFPSGVPAPPAYGFDVVIQGNPPALYATVITTHFGVTPPTGGDDGNYPFNSTSGGFKGLGPGTTPLYEFFNDGTYTVKQGSPLVVIESGTWS